MRDKPRGKEHKNFVTFFEVPEDLDMEEYGDTKGEHLKVKFGGLVIQGSPMGGNGYRADELGRIIRALKKVNMQVDKTPSLQVKSVLHQICGKCDQPRHENTTGTYLGYGNGGQYLH